MGQFIRDGSRILFETVMNVEESRCGLVIGEEPADPDGLNYLAGKNVDFVRAVLFFRVCMRRERICTGREPAQPAGC